MQTLETIQEKITATQLEIEATKAQLDKHASEGTFEKELYAQQRLNALGDVLKRYEDELATAQTEAAQKQAREEREALEAALVTTAKEADELHTQILTEEKKCDEYIVKSQAKANALLEQHWAKREQYRQIIRELGFSSIEQFEVFQELVQRLEIRESTMRLRSLLRGEAWHETSTGGFSQAEIRHMGVIIR